MFNIIQQSGVRSSLVSRADLSGPYRLTNLPLFVGWLVFFYIPSTARSFRDIAIFGFIWVEGTYLFELVLLIF